MPAIIEIRSFPSSSEAMDEMTAVACAGFTQRKMISASRMASALEPADFTPSEEAVCSADSRVLEETMTLSPVVSSDASIPRTRAHPIFPAPSTA